MAVADKRSENGGRPQGIERGVRAVSTQTAVAAQEESFSMSVDTDLLTDVSPSELEDTHLPDAAGVAIGERNDVADEAEAADEADALDPAEAPAEDHARFSWTRLLALGVLPSLALLLALAAGYLKWLDVSTQQSQTAAEQSVRAATESTVALLTYRSDTVDRDLTAAADRLTGGFRDQYTQLITSVVAPGAKQQHISAVATVPSAASVSASADHAVVLVYVNQTTTIGSDSPTQTTSCVRVTLDKVHDRWLISQFDPV
jgi:Mce-associated membrane protein